MIKIEKGKIMTREELNKILKNHEKWLNGKGEERADLSGANLCRADLVGSNLIGANLSEADLSEAYLSEADLSGANLRRADLSEAYLSEAYLSEANLRRADLRRADLIGANLSEANLSEANLSEANLCRADLSRANLSRANLRKANLSGADLSGADLSEADLSEANLIGADLSGANGLVSTIDFMKMNFERTDEGYIAYKTFGSVYASPETWKIESGSIISENVNFNRTIECGSGINVAPLKWVRKNYNGDIWKVLIRWEWLCGVCVPYNTDGKIRCERVELIGKDVSND